MSIIYTPEFLKGAKCNTVDSRTVQIKTSGSCFLYMNSQCKKLQLLFSNIQ